MFNLEILESRQLLSTGTAAVAYQLLHPYQLIQPTIFTVANVAHLSKNGTLIVNGTTGNDQISLSTSKPSGNIVATVAYASIHNNGSAVYVSLTTRDTAKVSYAFYSPS